MCSTVNIIILKEVRDTYLTFCEASDKTYNFVEGMYPVLRITLVVCSVTTFICKMQDDVFEERISLKCFETFAAWGKVVLICKELYRIVLILSICPSRCYWR